MSRLLPVARCSIACLLLCAAGIQAGGESRPQSPSTPPGIVFQVGGVGGIGLMGLTTRWSLPRAGLPHEIREFTWTHGKGHVLLDLQDTRHCMAKAQELAEEIRKVKADQPDRPVYVLAHSGGGVVTAAELLPGTTIERIVLLSAAVSNYDLRAGD